MSYVANAILTFSIMEEEKDRLKDVNRFFTENQRNSGFVSCDDENLPKGWYGGYKMLETEIHIGAFNYLNVDGLIEHLKTIRWEEPQNVQLFIHNQDDEKFYVYELECPPLQK